MMNMTHFTLESKLKHGDSEKVQVLWVVNSLSPVNYKNPFFVN